MFHLFNMLNKHVKNNLKYTPFDVSKWNVSNVTNMEHMFDNSPITTINFDLSNWDVSKVTNMNKMFYYCSAFTGKGLDKWNTSSLESAE